MKTVKDLIGKLWKVDLPIKKKEKMHRIVSNSNRKLKNMEW